MNYGGKVLEITKSATDSERNGLRGVITSVSTDGMLYGNWGRFEVNPERDKFIIIGERKDENFAAYVWNGSEFVMLIKGKTHRDTMDNAINLLTNDGASLSPEIRAHWHEREICVSILKCPTCVFNTSCQSATVTGGCRLYDYMEKKGTMSALRSVQPPVAAPNGQTSVSLRGAFPRKR